MYQTHYVPAYTNHLLHLVLTLVTFGLWFPVWVLIWLVNHNRTVARQEWVPITAQPQYGMGIYGQQNQKPTAGPPAPLPQGWSHPAE